MARTRLKAKGRRENSSFASMPHHLFRGMPNKEMASETAKLSHIGFRLLCCLLNQYNGKNNGDLTTAQSIVKWYGLTAPASINRAKIELLALGFIERTRRGGRNRCDLFSLTWLGIDECDNKLEVNSNVKASNLWKSENENFRDADAVRKWREMNGEKAA